MDLSSASPKTAEGRVASFAARCLIAGVALASIVLAFSTFSARAIGPDLPLRFHDLERGVELMVEPGRFNKVDVVRILYSGGRALREQYIDLKPETRAGGMAAAAIPLDLEMMSNMPPGPYAIKLVASGSLLGPENSAVPLHLELWLYVAVDKSGVRRITSEEYSAAVDPAEIGRAVSGREILLHRGGGAEAKVPLRDSEHYQAIPLGRTGGAVEESPR